MFFSVSDIHIVFVLIQKKYLNFFMESMKVLKKDADVMKKIIFPFRKLNHIFVNSVAINQY